MAIVLDSSVFIEAERRGLALSAIVALAEPQEELAMAAVTAAEILLGVHLTPAAPQNAERTAWVERMIARFPVLSFDLTSARVYAEVWATLRLAGNLIAPHDLMIGATALAYGFDVMTHNVRDFDRIPGLTIRQPGW